MSVLIVCAHPDLPHSRVNAALFAAARGLPDVTTTDLYGAYPDFFIDVPAEQAALAAHDTIVLQHPLYWYSVPALLKHWIDHVLLQGWAYGPGGTRLQGKRWAHALSTGGQPASYTAEGLHRHTLAEFLTPLHRTATLCSMRWLDPFVTPDADRLAPADIDAAAAAYRAWLQAL
ncbi:MAG TPA: NAD(P)H-dependent oxidoreductase [Burkholderiaceae bacterium]|nr:NAD(P)H-dependent oxidoreductase [Burkholderiaceae bacterium]